MNEMKRNEIWIATYLGPCVATPMAQCKTAVIPVR